MIGEGRSVWGLIGVGGGREEGSVWGLIGAGRAGEINLGAD